MQSVVIVCVERGTQIHGIRPLNKLTVDDVHRTSCKQKQTSALFATNGERNTSNRLWTCLLQQMSNLERNSLAAIPQNLFRNLPSLKVIQLNDNNIKGGFFLPENVTIITLARNKLSLKDLELIVEGKRKLINLNFDACDLKHVEDGAFLAMKDLETLIMRYNFLSFLNPRTLDGLSHRLTTLDFKWNNISSIADGTFRSTSQLTTLKLNGNRLTRIPDFRGITSIISL